MTGKGWAPGKAVGWPHNPAGKSYSERKNKAPKGISSNDYAANFDDFLERRAAETNRFVFGLAPANRIEATSQGIGANNGIDPDKINVPDVPARQRHGIRSDIADYMYEIQWFDSHLAECWISSSNSVNSTIRW